MSSITDFIKGTAHDANACRYIITGSPGAGKTTVIKHLEDKGESVVHEAATDVIVQRQAEGIEAPWREEDFKERIVKLQQERQQAVLTKTVGRLGCSFFDRAPIDTISYSLMFKEKPSELLQKAVQEVVSSGYYNKTVFLIQNLGFCETNTVRIENQEESMRIEACIKKTYLDLGFKVIIVPPATVEERVQLIVSHINQRE